ncbi:MAG: cupin domain-containing protein [Chitinispirillaceae bacterium]|nr:cupin domain-containing protein [Chitinispirillaceae bacterium]
MPKIFHSNELNFASGPFNREPFGLLTALPYLCKQADSRHLVFDIRKLPPGEYSFPYHYHRSAEEAMYIICGSMTVRTKNGFQIVNTGDVLFFETGEQGAHQFLNHTSDACTYFDVKTFYELDIVVYPDSDKLMISKYNEVFNIRDQEEYFSGEADITNVWKNLQGGKSSKAPRESDF